MRKYMLTGNGIIAVFFVVFFAYTFFGRAHLNQLARDFVTAKTVTYSAPVVDLAEVALKNEMVGKFLPQDQRAIAEREIAEYRANPEEYIAKLTGKSALAIENNQQNPAMAKVAAWKLGIRNHYYRVLERLLVDLRIFSGTNIVAAAIAFILAFRDTGRQDKQLAWISFLLFVALIYTLYLYIDSFSFFTILFNSYMGWTYPALMFIAFLSLYLKHAPKQECIS